MPRPPITAMHLRAAPTLQPARDQPARKSAAEEVTQIGREERHPEADEALLDLEAARHQVDGEPVGDEEPHGIGEGLREDVAPGLRQPEQHAIRQPAGPRSASGVGTVALPPSHRLKLGRLGAGTLVPGRVVLLAPADDQPPLLVADPRMLLRPPVHARNTSTQMNPSEPVMRKAGRQLSNMW